MIRSSSQPLSFHRRLSYPRHSWAVDLFGASFRARTGRGGPWSFPTQPPSIRNFQKLKQSNFIWLDSNQTWLFKCLSSHFKNNISWIVWDYLFFLDFFRCKICILLRFVSHKTTLLFTFHVYWWWSAWHIAYDLLILYFLEQSILGAAMDFHLKKRSSPGCMALLFDISFLFYFELHIDA